MNTNLELKENGLKQLTLLNEKWKILDDRYAVSTMGRLVTFHRYKVNTKGVPKAEVMKPALSPDGYLKTVFWGKSSSIHRIVITAFIPNSENKKTINHKNGIKDDNRLENLEWATTSENILHGYRNGLIPPLRGSLNGMAKLTEDIVSQIKNGYKNRNCTRKQYAQRFGIKEHHVKDIMRGRTWKHVLLEK